MCRLGCSIFIFLALSLTGCAEKWDGFVYQNKSSLSNYLAIGSYSSLGACRDAALATLESVSSISAGDYECGLNCELTDDGMRICQKTER